VHAKQPWEMTDCPRLNPPNAARLSIKLRSIR
jgi:hypothetical protein